MKNKLICMTAWDGLLIDEYDPEFDACQCFDNKPVREERARVVASAPVLPSPREEVDECFDRLNKIFGENVVLLYENAKQETIMEMFPNIEHYVGGWRDGCLFIRQALAKMGVSDALKSGGGG